MVNSQIERDFNDQSALKRPGRLDFRTLNLVDDAGDGYPGLQQAIINRMKLGTDTSVYYCTTLAEIVAAIADIGTGSGLIFIINNITLTATIDIDGGGIYIIEGLGDTTIDCGGDRPAFDITSAESCIIRDITIDASDLTTATTEVITVNEGSDNKVTIDNVTIVGDGTNGYGIALASNNNVVTGCNLSELRMGIVSTGDYNMIIGNNCNNNDYWGIYISVASYNTVVGNNCSNNDANHVNSSGGIYLIGDSDYSTVVGNVCCLNNNAGGGDGYGIFVGAVACNENVVVGNSTAGNDTDCDLVDEGTDTILGGGVRESTSPLEDDLTYEGIILNITTAAGAFGESMYISANNTVNKADANAVATMPCIGVFIDTDIVLTYGTIRDDSWNWTAGDIIYVSAAAAGGLVSTAPAGGGDQVQVVGVATSADEIFINPSLVLVEVI